VRRALTDSPTGATSNAGKESDPFVASAIRAHRRTCSLLYGRPAADAVLRRKPKCRVSSVAFRRGPSPTRVIHRRPLYVLRCAAKRRTGEPLIVTEGGYPSSSPTSSTTTPSPTPAVCVLSDAGITVDRIELEITAEMAGPAPAQLLDTAIGAPLLRINAWPTRRCAHHFLTGLFSPIRSRMWSAIR